MFPKVLRWTKREPIRTSMVGGAALYHDTGVCTQRTQRHRAAREGCSEIQTFKLLVEKPFDEFLQREVTIF